jgi:hypothetical protein
MFVLIALATSEYDFVHWTGDETILQVYNVHTQVATIPKQIVQINRHAFTNNKAT